MKKHKLDGFTVIVSPTAEDAADILKNVRATVIAVERVKGTDVIHVDFDEKSFGAFRAASLLTLKPLFSLRQILASKGKSLGAEDKKELDKIIKLLELGEQGVALKHAVDRKSLQPECITDCATWISMQATLNEKQAKQRRNNS